jgi:hypothetical protein
MRKVLVYDAGSDKWYGQATTAEGDNFPSGRQFFCAVAASAPDNSSHNIYMYAGESSGAVPDSYSDMWILSVPAFRWIRIDVESVPRKRVGCTTVADRYMVTYGGMKSGWGYSEEEEDYCDQENYGLRLFDLSKLTWTSRYDGPSSGRHAFKVPGLVYDVIGGNEQGSATRTAPTAGFETAAMASLFQMSSSSSSMAPPPSKKSSNTGAIAGGVVGGLAGIVMVIVGVFCFMKRRKRRASPYDPHSASAVNKSDGQFMQREVNTSEQEYAQELEAQQRPPQELEARYTPPL